MTEELSETEYFKNNRHLSDCKSLATCGICSELYKEAKLLHCSHTYCLTCLLKLHEHSEQQCPECREKFVPIEIEHIKLLPDNNFCNELAILVTKYDLEGEPELTEAQKAASEATLKAREKKEKEGSGSSVLQLLSRLLEANGQTTSPRQAEQVNIEVECDGCNKRVEDAVYHCGVCGDTGFDLCAECEDKPRQSLHDPKHTLLKVKDFSKLKNEPLLKDEAIGLEPDDARVDHGVICDSCATPIIGMRFKCGNCVDYDLCASCENNHSPHRKDHVLVVLRSPLIGLPEHMKLVKD